MKAMPQPTQCDLQSWDPSCFARMRAAGLKETLFLVPLRWPWEQGETSSLLCVEEPLHAEEVGLRFASGDTHPTASSWSLPALRSLPAGQPGVPVLGSVGALSKGMERCLGMGLSIGQQQSSSSTCSSV